MASFSIWSSNANVFISCDKTQVLQKHLTELAYLSRSLSSGKRWKLSIFHKRPGLRSMFSQESKVLYLLGSMWKKNKTDPSLFTALINGLPTHRFLSYLRYLPSPLSMAPSRLLPIAWVLSQDGCWILNEPAGLEPEKHLRQASVFYPDCAAHGVKKLLSAVVINTGWQRLIKVSRWCV